MASAQSFRFLLDRIRGACGSRFGSKTSHIGDDLPAGRLRNGTPIGHPFGQISILQQPENIAFRGLLLNPLAAQAGPFAAAQGVWTMTFRAVVGERFEAPGGCAGSS